MNKIPWDAVAEDARQVRRAVLWLERAVHKQDQPEIRRTLRFLLAEVGLILSLLGMKESRMVTRVSEKLSDLKCLKLVPKKED